MLVLTIVVVEMVSNDQVLKIFQRQFRYGSDEKRKIKVLD